MSNENVQAFYLKDYDVQPLSPTDSGIAQPLPPTLVVPPGNYSVWGQEYSMQAEGLYRFLDARHENRQCIVFQNDVFALMSAIAWLVSHGYRDNEKPFEELKALACAGKVIVTCGACSAFAKQLFQELGLPARIVQTLSLLDRNGYNDGHVLTEVVADGKWIVFDPDVGALYSHRGERLNILQLTQHARRGDFQIEPLTLSMPIATGHFTAEGYAYDLWYETVLSTPELRQQTFQRILQVPLIVEDGSIYFTTPTEAERRRIEELYPEEDFQYIPQKEFNERFYALNNARAFGKAI
jgi:hypothetical protein